MANPERCCTAIAKAEETYVVFGIPRLEIETGTVDHVVPLHRIAAKIVYVAGLTARSDLWIIGCK